MFVKSAVNIYSFVLSFCLLSHRLAARISLPFYIFSTFRSLEMHSNLKRRYKIFICSVILGEPKSFRNYKGFSIVFSKILGVI